MRRYAEIRHAQGDEILGEMQVVLLRVSVGNMQVSWELMQSEGTLTSSSGNGAAPEVGVYVGIQQMEYGGMAAPYLSKIGPFSATGGPFSVAAGRMSFIYGLKGPAVHPQPFVSSTLQSLNEMLAHRSLNAELAHFCISKLPAQSPFH